MAIANSTAIYAVGVPQTGGALYGACLDCDNGNGLLQTVDGHVSTGGSSNKVDHLHSQRQTVLTPLTGVFRVIFNRTVGPKSNSHVDLDQLWRYEIQ